MKTASTTKHYVEALGRWVHFAHRDTMRLRHTHPKASFAAAEAGAASVPVTPLPVDCTGGATVSAPMDGNDTLGDCMEAMACHVDGFWTYGRGQAGWTQSSFALPALESQYEAASGGDNGLDEPTLLTQCWKPGLAGQAAATYDDSLDVDVTNVPLARYCIDWFFHINMMWSVPDDFLQNFQPGGTWQNPDTPDPAKGHGTPLTDIDLSGLYRLFTWGSWVWVSPAFVASVDPACFVVFSRRQFNQQGYDAHGRHVSAVAAAWVAIGGDGAKAAAVVAMFPPVGPSPAPPSPTPTPSPTPAAPTLEGAQAAVTAALEVESIWDQAQAIAAANAGLAAYWPSPGS